MCTESPTPLDSADTAFPASETTPGQSESRSAYARWREMLLRTTPAPTTGDLPKPGWMDDYLALRAEGWTWRKAALIAWSASPTKDRWPASQSELATQVLGLRSDRTIRKWREKDPGIDERISRAMVEPLMRHRRDVIDALVFVAKTEDPKAHPDRRMFLEMTGDYKPKGQMALTGENGGPVQHQGASDFDDLSDAELDQAILNMTGGG